MKFDLNLQSEKLDFYLNARSKLVLSECRSSEGEHLPNDLSSLSRKKGLLEPSSMCSSSCKNSPKVSPFITKKPKNAQEISKRGALVVKLGMKLGIASGVDKSMLMDNKNSWSQEFKFSTKTET